MAFWSCHRGPVVLRSPLCPVELGGSGGPAPCTDPPTAPLGLFCQPRVSMAAPLYLFGSELPSLFIQQVFNEDLRCAVLVAWYQ